MEKKKREREKSVGQTVTGDAKSKALAVFALSNDSDVKGHQKGVSNSRLSCLCPPRPVSSSSTSAWVSSSFTLSLSVRATRVQ